MNTPTKMRAIFAAAAGLAALAAATTSHAQSIDYGSLQQLFNEPVTTSATGSPQRASETPVAMDIISADDIKRSGATDIPTILSRVAGVQVLEWGAGNADVGVRGFNQANSPRLLVLVNGRQVYTDTYGYTAWSSLSVQLQDIRQIEVVKGPNSALFGFNAVEGVINIVTYNPKYDKDNALTVEGGTQSFQSAQVSQTLTLFGGRVAARVFAGESAQDQFKNVNPGVKPAEVRDPVHAAAGLDLVAQLTPHVQMRLEGDWTNTQGSMVTTTASWTRSRDLTDSQRITLIDESPIGLLQLSAYQNNSSTELMLNQIDWDNRVSVVSGQDLFKVSPRDTMRVSIEYRHNSLNTSPINTGRVAYDVYSPSVMWTSNTTSKLSLTLAARYDILDLSYQGSIPSVFPIQPSQFRRHIDTLSANAGAVYKATSADTLKVSYARGVQSPSLAEFGGLLLPYPYAPLPFHFLAVIGNPAFKPSVVTNYEADWDHDLTALSAKASVRVFYQTVTNLSGAPALQLDIAPTLTTAAATEFINVGSAKMGGAEFEVSGTFGKGWRWNANYLYSDTKDRATPGVVLASREADFSRASPKHTGNLGLGWTGGPWTVDGYAHFVSSYTGYALGAGPSAVGAYGSLAGRVAYKINDRLSVSLNGDHLQSARTWETTGVPIERRVWGALNANW